MSAKIYYFPRDPEIRAELLAMPTEKRKKLLDLMNKRGRLRWKILQNRLKRILARREERKREMDLQDTITE
ncbi:hypothetical protein ACFL0H_00300 [Thermodesulfobacteriota bacterium]